MSKLPTISARDLLKILHQMGYDVDRQTGSHIMLRNKHSPHRRIVVPNHREIAKGTLRAIIKQTGLTIDEFLKKF